MMSGQVASQVPFKVAIHKIWGPNEAACTQGKEGQKQQEAMPEAGEGIMDTRGWPYWGDPSVTVHLGGR